MLTENRSVRTPVDSPGANSSSNSDLLMAKKTGRFSWRTHELTRFRGSNSPPPMMSERYSSKGVSTLEGLPGFCSLKEGRCALLQATAVVVVSLLDIVQRHGYLSCDKCTGSFVSKGKSRVTAATPFLRRSSSPQLDQMFLLFYSVYGITQRPTLEISSTWYTGYDF